MCVVIYFLPRVFLIFIIQLTLTQSTAVHARLHRRRRLSILLSYSIHKQRPQQVCLGVKLIPAIITDQWEVAFSMRSGTPLTHGRPLLPRLRQRQCQQPARISARLSSFSTWLVHCSPFMYLNYSGGRPSSQRLSSRATSTLSRLGSAVLRCRYYIIG